MINPKKYLDNYNKFFPDELTSALTKNIIIKIANLNKYKEIIGSKYIEKCAYIVATAYHESNRTFGLYKELRQVKIDTPQRKKVRELQDRYWLTGYYGRGPFQLTWKENYKKAQNLTGLPLLADPDILLKNLDANYEIGINFLCKGMFTGVSLSNFINQKGIDYYNSRKTINLLDKARLIANYAVKFEALIRDSLDA